MNWTLSSDRLDTGSGCAGFGVTESATLTTTARRQDIRGKTICWNRAGTGMALLLGAPGINVVGSGYEPVRCLVGLRTDQLAPAPQRWDAVLFYHLSDEEGGWGFG